MNGRIVAWIGRNTDADRVVIGAFAIMGHQTGDTFCRLGLLHPVSTSERVDAFASPSPFTFCEWGDGRGLGGSVRHQLLKGADGVAPSSIAFARLGGPFPFAHEPTPCVDEGCRVFFVHDGIGTLPGSSDEEAGNEYESPADFVSELLAAKARLDGSERNTAADRFEAIRRLVNRLEGTTFAFVLAFTDEPDRLYAVAHGRPLTLVFLPHGTMAISQPVSDPDCRHTLEFGQIAVFGVDGLIGDQYTLEGSTWVSRSPFARAVPPVDLLSANEPRSPQIQRVTDPDQANRDPRYWANQAWIKDHWTELKERYKTGWIAATEHFKEGLAM